ncbi:hypothetical protein [Salinicola sp. CPA57]|uniref:hypothetical protein n=1 Tax=Salinicola sp. CPA57 TaxID=1949080 RepID=UPI001E341477|nr:hypothetical protein [Salinicola sp. CPA57]
MSLGLMAGALAQQRHCANRHFIMDRRYHFVSFYIIDIASAGRYFLYHLGLGRSLNIGLTFFYLIVFDDFYKKRIA